jgi:hypothetical protein
MKKSAGLVVSALTLASSLFLVASQGYAMGPTQGALEGSWVETDTRVNGTFVSLLTFTRDLDPAAPIRGEATEAYVNPAVPLQTTGHGEWRKLGNHQYAISLLFLVPNGIFVRARINQTITVDADFKHYTGDFQTEILDPSGNVLDSLTGTVDARRVLVDSPSVPTVAEGQSPETFVSRPLRKSERTVLNREKSINSLLL